MKTSRRNFLTAAFVPFEAALVSAECSAPSSAVHTENTDSPFFEHYHQLSVPVQALIKPPIDGIIVKTLPVDQGSYDVEGFDQFVASSGLKADDLRRHAHEVSLSREQLERIAQGEKDVEIRVISKNGNYVHNFLITATPAVLARIRKQRAGKTSEIL